MSWANAGEQPKTLVDTDILGLVPPNSSGVVNLIPASLKTGMCFFGGKVGSGIVVDGEYVKVTVSLKLPNQNPDPADIYTFQYIATAPLADYQFEASAYIPKQGMVIEVTTSNMTDPLHLPGNLSYSVAIVQFS